MTVIRPFVLLLMMPTLLLPILLMATGCATATSTSGGAPGVHARAPELTFDHAAVAADHPVASAAGLAMLDAGGNAVDAAVAASFCLSVVRPYSCGIGGGGFMLIHLPADDEHAEARDIVLCYRERSPARVGPDFYADKSDTASWLGPDAVGIPGTVRGLLYALETYGTLDRQTVLAPAIRAAREGYRADQYHAEAAVVAGERLAEHPELRRRAWYLWKQICHEGELEPGDLVCDPEQALALELIAEQGAEVFYSGVIASAIVAAMEPGRGSITMSDLREYAIETTVPLRGTFGGREVLVMPPPSSGGVAILQMLAMFDHTGLPTTDPADPLYVHTVAEAMKHAFADRSRWLADAAFAPVPLDALLAPWYLVDRAEAIDLERTFEAEYYGSTETRVPDDSGTSHISIIDANGAAVSCTETVNLLFGSLVTVPGFGFVLNNEMDDFTVRRGEANAFGLRQSDWNLPAAGKRPLSSMSPTIVLRDGEVELVVGGSGGPRIITGTLQVMLNALHFDYSAAEAVNAPRFHHQWQPHVLEFEKGWTATDTVRTMEDIGHETGECDSVAHVQLLKVTADGISAASDPRKGGLPAGR